jgi:hypothetical protein
LLTFKYATYEISAVDHGLFFRSKPGKWVLTADGTVTTELGSLGSETAG